MHSNKQHKMLIHCQYFDNFTLLNYPMNKILLFSFFIIVSFSLKSQVVINEFDGANWSGNLNSLNDYADWVELYNTSASSTDISGWYLTDKPTNPTMWSFPAGTIIPAHGFIVIWCDKSSGATTAGNYHTNFKITQTAGEFLGLTNLSAAYVDSFHIASCQMNQSRGRTTDGGSTWSVFATPTMGTSNAGSTAYNDYDAEPTFSMAAGFYPSTITVSISCADPGAIIRYTTNGDEPIATSTQYTAPITLSQTTMLRARSFNSSANLYPSFIQTNTYFINDYHTTDVISMAGDFNGLFNSWSVSDIVSTIEFFDKNGVQQFEGEGKVDPHGNDSWAFAQKGIDFEMEDDLGYAHTCDYPIFHVTPRPNYDHIILKAGASDNYPFSWGNHPCHMRDAFVQSYEQKYNLDLDERSYEPTILYLNGQYWGVYEIREKADEADYTSYYYNQKSKDIDVLAYWGGLNIKYGSDTAWNNLYNYIMANNLAVTSNYNYVGSKLDLNSVIDYMIFNTYVVNSDWINWNTMWWRGRNMNGMRDKWTYDLWDEDNVFDLGQNYTGWQTTGMTASPCDVQSSYSNAGPQMGHLDILNKLLLNTDFKANYINRYADLMNTMLDCDTTLAYFNQFVATLTPEMPGQVARWGGSMSGWQTNLNFLQQKIQERCSFIDSVLTDCYQITGPYDVTVLVNPPGAGTVQLNTLHPATYPFSGQYFGGVNISLSALPNMGNTFTNWTLSHHTPTPGTSAPTIQVGLVTGDTIIANFNVSSVPMKTITLIVDLPGTGTITINGQTITTYPYTNFYPLGGTVTLHANPSAPNHFLWWESIHHLMNPSPVVSSVSFNLLDNDTIIAHFGFGDLIPEISDGGFAWMVYPTLTNSVVKVDYQLLENDAVNFGLYDFTGKRIAELFNVTSTGGELHTLTFNLADMNLSPGLYFVDAVSSKFHKTTKVVFVK